MTDSSQTAQAPHHDVVWVDAGREPQCRADPRHPNGIDLDTTTSTTLEACRIDLPYPAKRCGVYVIRCLKPTCGLSVTATTAGRRDDPRSLTMPCRRLEPQA